MLPNCPQYVIATFAILRLGAIVVNINPIYTAREVLDVATDSGMRALVTLDALAPLALGDSRPDTALERIIVTSLGRVLAGRARRRRASTARSRCADLADAGEPDLPLVPIAPDDLAVLQYTGGTTGTPKGAMLTHAQHLLERGADRSVHVPDAARAARRAICSSSRTSTSTRSRSG